MKENEHQDSLLIPVPSLVNASAISLLQTVVHENDASNMTVMLPMAVPIDGIIGSIEDSNKSSTHRAACHRCGNMRKSIFPCVACPNIYCKKCTELVVSEYGADAFIDGCPKCREQCCCGKNKTLNCTRIHHCYR